MAWRDLDIGAVSAYAIAVEHGYTGTEEEWANEQAAAGTNARIAKESAETAVAAAKAAQSNLDSIKPNTEQAITDIQTEGSTQRSSVISTGDAQNQRVMDTGAEQSRALSAQGDIEQKKVIAAGDEQVSRITNAGNDAVESVTLEKTNAINDVQNTKTEAVNSVETAKTTAVEAVKSAESAAIQNIGTGVDSTLSISGKAADAKKTGDSISSLKNDVVAITPDDTAVDGKPWSSKKTVDMLCPPLEESGNPVVCYPVVGYPLGVKFSWTSTQEGSGDPSPENIRPIKGRDSVRVERREDDLAYTLTLPSTVYGGEVDAVTGEGQREWRCITITGREPCHVYSTLFYIDFYQTDSFVQEPAIDSTSGKSSHYPYQLYGKNGFIGITLDGGAVVYSPGDKYPNTNDGLREWMDYLAAQYAAGTPVQICYKQANPVPFTATGGASIKALSGTNTVLTDADSVTVTGRADPIQTVSKLSERIAALEAAATNITE